MQVSTSSRFICKKSFKIQNSKNMPRTFGNTTKPLSPSISIEQVFSSAFKSCDRHSKNKSIKDFSSRFWDEKTAIVCNYSYLPFFLPPELSFTYLYSFSWASSHNKVHYRNFPKLNQYHLLHNTVQFVCF